ncbi:MAG TPA: carboxypeptidase-like regulatory domain-containing protein [Pyrinomonadaceae bacterium]
MKLFLLTVFVSVSLFGSQGSAQTAMTSVEARPAPSITGRVVASGGNFPIANARVMARAVGVGGGPSSTQMVMTNEEGKFQLTNLRSANYAIRVGAAGYILEPSSSATSATFYRPGEEVTFRMVKGGVITGRVLNTNGEPMTLARVRVVRVKDPEGGPVRDTGGGRDWITDDRGNYRIYGLEPGAYAVSAGPPNAFRVAATPGQNTDTAFTYHPSATLEGASLVNVYPGDETRGIDIRYRIQSSNFVSGIVAGNGTASSRAVISVTLSHVATSVASTIVIPAGPNTAFSFDSVSDGAYELTAVTALGTSDAAMALPQRVTVRGANVGDVVLKLTPFGSVTGRVMLETTTDAVEACRESNVASPEAVLITARRDKEATKQIPAVISSLPVEAQPDVRGEFSLTNMTAGRYSLDVRPPNRLWYVRGITWATNPQPKFSLNSLTLKQGERLQGLTINMARGAASISGRVSAAADGESLHVYVVPADTGALRYSESPVKPDGTFSVEHLSPGRYWLLARTPAVGDTAKTLRRAAEKANLAVELQPCQQLVNYTLNLTH